jgi:rare lipoprotein A
MGTIVTVTATSSGKSVNCKVADRGPYVNGWIIDLSKDTFSALAPLDAGVISVRLTW